MLLLSRGVGIDFENNLAVVDSTEAVPPKPQNRYIQRWKTSVILVPRVEHCPIRWEIVSATSNLAMEKSWQLFPGAGTMK